MNDTADSTKGASWSKIGVWSMTAISSFKCSARMYAFPWMFAVLWIGCAIPSSLVIGEPLKRKQRRNNITYVCEWVVSNTFFNFYYRRDQYWNLIEKRKRKGKKGKEKEKEEKKRKNLASLMHDELKQLSLMNRFRHWCWQRILSVHFFSCTRWKGCIFSQSIFRGRSFFFPELLLVKFLAPR